MCWNSDRYAQDENQSQPSCHCNPIERTCMKHNANDYGIKMIDCDNNTVDYIEDYSDCYMLLILDIEKALSIPENLLTCKSNSVSTDNVKMPLIEREDIILAGNIAPMVFALARDHDAELYWREIVMDKSTIDKIFYHQSIVG